MAQKKQFITKHSVFHDSKKYGRFTPITLSDEHAEPLLAKGIIAHQGEAVSVARVPALSASTLTKLNREELFAHGKSIGLELDEAANKDALLEAFAAHAAALALEGAKD